MPLRKIGVVSVESEAAFPSDHYPLRLRLPTLLALLPCGNLVARARYKVGSKVSQKQQQLFMDGCASLLSTHSPALPQKHRHFLVVMTASADAIFGPPSTPGTVPRFSLWAFHVLHNLLRAHPW